jgi:hypothetical protein
MQKFRVELPGRNFLIPVEGKGEVKSGLFTNRLVEAENEPAAELAAVNPSMVTGRSGFI